MENGIRQRLVNCCTIKEAVDRLFVAEATVWRVVVLIDFNTLEMCLLIKPAQGSTV